LYKQQQAARAALLQRASLFYAALLIRHGAPVSNLRLEHTHHARLEIRFEAEDRVLPT
jgi:hypothetical protein